VPGVFHSVRIARRDYVDGGVWSPTNLDVAPVGRGARVLCLVPTAALHAAPAALVRALGRGWKAATALEAAVARASGAQVTIVQPDAASAAAMEGDLMNARRRSQVMAAGFAQGTAAAGASARAR
jgi:NTE family protein